MVRYQSRLRVLSSASQLLWGFQLSEYLLAVLIWKHGKQKCSNVANKVVVVAVKALREIPRWALVWALAHVVQPGDCIMLLVVIPPHDRGKKLWGFPRFSSDCTTGQRRFHSGISSEQKDVITDTCTQMMLQLHDVYDPDMINVRIKIVSRSRCGVAATEAKSVQTNWVVLDKRLKQRWWESLWKREEVTVLWRSGKRVGLQVTSRFDGLQARLQYLAMMTDV